MPFILRTWLLATWFLSIPVTIFSRVLHNRMGADPARFSERLGLGAAPGESEVIWFHAASLGEVMQIKPLVEMLVRTGEARVLVTTTTVSSSDWVLQEMPSVIHRYAPIDTPSAVSRFLDGWPIVVAVFVEGDLWPRLVTRVRKRGIPQVLLNARPSRTRERFPQAFAWLLAPFALVTCRSRQVAESMLALGLSADRVRVVSDLKATAEKLPAPAAEVEALANEIGSRPVWLAASTHPDDEDAILTAHRRVMEAFPNALLIIAPRHPKRGEPLKDMARDRGFSALRRSLEEGPASAINVYIADTLGELGIFYSISPVAFLGGSFGQEGGHNPFEPARFGTAIISGTQTANFADAYAALAEAGAALQIEAPGDLGRTIADLICSDQARKMGEAALKFVETREDGISTSVRLITEVLRAGRQKDAHQEFPGN